MAIRDDILTLKNKEGTLAGNKVCNFAYDDTAYEDDTTTGANGVSTYNYNNHNNIPVKDVEVLKVNPTIISKGFRSQVSTLSRMLLNHIFGRVSYNLNKTVDTFNALLTNLYNYIGQPNGLATLDNTGRLPYSQLPLSAVEYKGAWNANTNTPTLASGTGTFGDEYIVSTQGTQNLGEGSITYKVGDRVIYNGSIWQRIPASSVRTVNSKTPDANGNITINASDMVTPDVYGYDRTSMGKTWERANIMSGTFHSVYYANGIWVAGSTGGNGLYWSTDGKTWTQGLSSGYFYAVYYANGIWVAGGSSGLYWSIDGKTWTQGLSSVTFRCVYCAGGIWVAGSGNSDDGLYWSTDGKTWTQGLSSGYFYCVYYGDGIWVAGNGGNGLYWSTDGKTWTQGLSYNEFYCVYYANGIWVAGDFSGHGLWWSTDGKTWTQGLNSGYFLCVYYDNGIWVAGSNYGGLYYSEGVLTNNVAQILDWLLFAVDNLLD